MAPPLIGLTGGVSAGKSTALETFRELGADVISADAVVHQLYGEEQLRDAVAERWGDEVAPDGVVDRKRIAKIVFDRPDERQWLESLLWPLVGQRIRSWIEQLRHVSPPPRAGVIEVPLLFESGFDALCDATVTILASQQTVRARSESRGLVGVSEREDRQLSAREKAQKATFVVENEGTVSELRDKLSGILDKLGA